MTTYPKYARLPQWCQISGMSRTGTYYALAKGDLRAVKQGNITLIDVEDGLARMAALPAAKITCTRKAA